MTPALEAKAASMGQYDVVRDAGAAIVLRNRIKHVVLIATDSGNGRVSVRSVADNPASWPAGTDIDPDAAFDTTLPASGTLVRVYKSTGQFQSDAERYTRNGWTVGSVTEHQPGSGLGRGLLLGLMALVWKPKPEIMVTYRKDA